MIPRHPVSRRLARGGLAILLTGCVQWSEVQEERTVVVGAGEACPGRDAPKRFELSLGGYGDGDAGEIVSTDEGPVEGEAYERAKPDGSVEAVKRCFYLVTVRYRSGG